MGWFPEHVGLKDHHVFWHEGYYYLVSIYLAADHYEDRFAYARSADLCSWEELTAVLSQRVPGAWDEFRIWAPFVYEENGLYYMYYAGVMNNFTQSIMLATSLHPADPASWQPQGAVFQPRHSGVIWQAGQWADCRDPMVMKVGETYYLYYTGRDDIGGIIGVATATSPLGPWRDWGAVLVLPVPPGGMAESPTVTVHEGLYYIFYYDTNQGERYRAGASPTGPWLPDEPLAPGAGHEVWRGQDGYDYTSFLTNYAVTISRLTWDTIFQPPRPVIGDSVFHLWLPLAVH